MSSKSYPVIDVAATGNNIRRLRLERGLSVRDLQNYFGFEEPQAIYKWQRGESLPSVDNLYALGNLLDVPMDQILVPLAVKLHIMNEQQNEHCCSSHFWETLRNCFRLLFCSGFIIQLILRNVIELPV